ncbi:hypothetical protein N7508_001137 [Penicillium antarcticum]|uniref:uncharacterized protein n=1 Tax=Penicillium antarcticum TaxID=416450 RepID=UPI002398B985|nr:uncharacterized protein N7508_001137 [Penicillium antarcticum]KAJ5316629.1 hypothetical protein N7508_001137 [Penicillium antarcticum]
MSSSCQFDKDAGEAMRLAVSRFRTKMEASNRQFIQDRYDEIDGMDVTDKEKVCKIAIYLRGLTYATSWADVKSYSHRLMDGVESPTIVSDEWRQMFLETWEAFSNENFYRDNEEEDNKGFHIPMPHDLVPFIKYTNGVEDPDFRLSGIPSFDPVWGLGDSPSGPVFDISEAREELRKTLGDYLCDDWLSNALDSLDEDLEVKIGFRTGTGCKQDAGIWYDAWESTYAYCRRFAEDDDPRHRDWAWRVVIYPAEWADDGPTTPYGPKKPIFDSIVEFLDWYGSWMDHLDMDKNS